MRCTNKGNHSHTNICTCFGRDGLRSFEVADVGLCSSAVEMVMGLTGKTKQQSQLILIEILKPTTTASKRAAAEALLGRRHVIPGFSSQTPLITFQEGMQLVRLLPAKHVQHVINHVDTTFQQVTAGDPRIHYRVAENAASDASVNRIARDGLGMQRDAVIGPVQSDDEIMGPAYKRQRLITDLARERTDMLVLQADFIQRINGGFEDRDRMAFLDCMRNVAFGAQLQVTNTAEDSVADSLTISDVAIDMGVFNQVKTQLSAVAKKYRDANNNEDPPKVKRFVDGQLRGVKAYKAGHRGLIEAGIRDYMAGNML